MEKEIQWIMQQWPCVTREGAISIINKVDSNAQNNTGLIQRPTIHLIRH
jgi:hypothetical protein